jgi:uncharacterized protein (TIGR02597 family)
MKTLTAALAILVAAVMAGNAAANDPVYSETVGYNTSAVPAGKMTMVSFPLLKQEVYSGAFTSKSGGVLTSSASNFDASLISAKNYASEPLYFIEITSSSNATSGLIIDILSATSTTVTVSTGDAASLSGTESFKIRKYLTLGDVFGANNSAGLKQGPSLSEADIVYALVNGNWKQYFYYDDQVGFDPTQWADLSQVGDAKDARIDPDQGILIARKTGSGSVSLVVTGTVKSTQAKIPVVAGMQIVTNPWPTPMTFAQLGLQTGNEATGLKQAPSVGEADVIYRLENGEWKQYFIYDDQIGFDPVQWTKLGDIADPSSTQIGVGEAILIKRVTPQSFAWSPAKNF